MILHPFGAPVVKGRFLRRYKRFFVDVLVKDAAGVDVVTTAHTANTGAMTGMLVPDAPVILTRHDGGKRAYPLELEAIDVGTSWVGCNTIRSNRVAEAFVRGGIFPELDGFHEVLREQPLGQSRVDLLLTSADGACFVEVKSVTLRDGQRAIFPDTVSERATKHVDELTRAARKGTRVVLLYLVQRKDVDVVAPAAAIDPTYAKAMKRAVKAGVEVVAAAIDVVDEGYVCAGRVRVEVA